jgi:putative CocE/NonD family hydrolase
MVPACKFMRTRDGTQLAASAFLPSTGMRHPTVLLRTPYGRNQPLLLRLAGEFCRRGIGMLVQDARGRFGSSGKWSWTSELDDTYDCIHWLDRQEWFNGSLYFLGLSISTLHSLKFLGIGSFPDRTRFIGLINLMGVADLYSLFYQSGALLLHWALPWCMQMGCNRNAATAWKKLDYRQLHIDPDRLILPPEIDGSLWQEVLQNPRRSQYWAGSSALTELPNISVPSLHISGWFDFVSEQVLKTYANIGGEKTLIIGPWDHSSIPRLLFKSSKESDQLVDSILNWIDRHRGGKPT